MRPDPTPRWRDRLAVALIDRSPKWSAMAASRAMGAAARFPLPRPVGRAAIDVYSRMFGVDLEDVDPESLADGFPTFDAFFTRTLRRGARPIDPSPDVMVSPCDGRLREISDIQSSGVVVAKGHEYGLGELLADAVLAERFRGGRQAVIYLHPRDYHRVHVPASGLVRSVTNVPGRLLPVTDASVEAEPRLFAVNERMIHVIQSERGCVAVVMVAAFGVGHMTCAYHPLQAHPDDEVRIDFLAAHPGQHPKPPFVAKGEELGVFHLGSTVVVLAEAGFVPAPGLVPGCRLELGTALLRWEGGG